MMNNEGRLISRPAGDSLKMMKTNKLTPSRPGEILREEFGAWECRRPAGGFCTRAFSTHSPPGRRRSRVQTDYILRLARNETQPQIQRDIQPIAALQPA